MPRGTGSAGPPEPGDERPDDGRPEEHEPGDTDRVAEIRALIDRYRSGDPSAFDGLVVLLMDELRAIASRRIRYTGGRRTLNTTLVVNEAYAKIRSSKSDVTLNDAGHFFALIAQVMRQIVIDYLKRERKHEEGRVSDELMDQFVAGVEREAEVQPGVSVSATEFSDALDRLATIDPLAARVVELRVYAGLDMKQIAEVVEHSLRTVERRMEYAKAWFRRHFS